MVIDPIYLVLFPIVYGVLFLLLPKRTLTIAALIMQVALLVLVFINFQYIQSHGAIVRNIGGWRNYLGITLRMDTLASVFVALTAVLFFFLYLYSFDPAYTTPLFFFLLAVTQGLLIGIFVSNDLFNIFVLIEVATVVIGLLIMFKRDSRAVYDGLLYLMINVVGMSLFLLGIGMLYKVAGCFDMDGVQSAVAAMEDGRALIVPYALIITAICLKSAIMPLFSWLPKAHGTPSAPSAVSALLSGLYVKVGIYLFIRVQHVFAPALDISRVFAILGFITAVAGFLLAIAQTDIKMILAYHTVSQIGMIMMGLNMGGDFAYVGSVAHIVNHAFFKSALFLTAGLMVDAYGTRNVYQIRGAFKRMPWVSAAAVMAMLGITGAPLFNGSISKYLMAHAAAGTVWEYALILINFGTVLSFVKYSRMFFGEPSGVYEKKPSHIRQIVVLILGVICLLGGLLGQPIWNGIFNAHVHIDPAGYAQKAAIYALSVAIGFLLYHRVLKKLDLSRYKNLSDLSFQGVCIAMGSFLFALLLVLRIHM